MAAKEQKKNIFKKILIKNPKNINKKNLFYPKMEDTAMQHKI